MTAMNLLKVRTTEVFRKNLRARPRTVVNIGGARSSKSHSIAQLLVMKAANERGKSLGITRKTMPSLRMTAYRLFIGLLKEYGLYRREQHNKTENYYEMNGNRIQFFGMDEPDKLKSTEFNYVWMEEANEFTYEDYVTLLTRLSGKCSPGEKNQIFLSLNPTDANGWIPKQLLKQKEVEVIKSSYKNNPFLGADYAEILENLKSQDENYYRIYALGEWGITQHLVYTEYDFCDALPENPGETIWGADFGYNNPSALVRADINDGELFVRECLYSPRLTNAGIISRLEDLIGENRHQPVYADSAEPGRIREIADAGFNAHPAEKSVRHGIDTLKRLKLHITKDSVNLIKEIGEYRWKTDMAGAALDEPVKFNDHALDALRYAVHTHFRANGFKPSLTIC